jgi:hypothetical protein
VANNFTKQEQIAFDDMVAGFDDALVIGKLATVYNNGLTPEEMERARDQFWIPAPMIGSSFNGFDQTANFGDLTETEVPVSIGYHKSDPRKLSAKNLRNESVLRQWGKAARQKLASDINFALFQTAALQGSVFVKRTGAATGFDDISLADAALTETGVPLAERTFVASPRTANLMAGDLAKRGTFNGAVQNAYERATLGIDVAGFDVYKNDQSISLAAAAGGATTVNGANQYYVPKATTQDNLGVDQNVDNRYSDLVVTSANYAGIKAGDAFTIAGVNSVHMISKQDTGQLQTFRVISKPAANTIRVAPAIISGTGATRPEVEFQNVTAAPANTAALTWLNTTTGPLNTFFVRDSLLLIPGSYALDPEDGWQVMRARTELGIGITYTRQGEINDLSVKARWDVDFGTALTAPQLAGVEMFNQA